MNRLFVLLLTLAIALSLSGAASADLVAHYKLDDGAGTVATDSTSNGYDGTLSGNPIWVVGYMDGALAFDGGDAITLPAGDMGLSAAEGAVAFWINASVSGGIQTIFWAGDNNTGGGFGGENETHIHLEGGPNASWDGGECSFYSQNGAFLFSDPTKGTDPAAAPVNPILLGDEQWHHIAANWSDSQNLAELYIDGELISSAAYGASYEFTNIYLGQMADGSRTYAGVLDEVQLYDAPLTEAEVALAMAGGIAPGPATLPVPADEAEDVLRDVTLSWTPGPYAVTHNVYLSTSFDDVNTASPDALVSEGQTPSTYEPPVSLEYGQTYYWRIDEVNKPSDNVVYDGPVWSFASEAYSYLIPDVNVTSSVPGGTDPNSLVNDPNAEGTSIDADTMWNVNPGGASEIVLDFDLGAVYRLDEMRVWNFNLELEGLGFLNFSVKDIAVESSIDGETWTPLGDHTLAQGTGSADNPGQPVKLEDAAAQYVRVIAKNTYGGAIFGLSEVHFYYIPTKASKPEPASGTEDLDPAVALSWRSGREAASHRVYLDTDPNAVADETTSFTTSNTNMLDLGVLDLGQTYYWKVVEVNEAEEPAAWPSDVWNLATTAYISVDDFESYTDEPGEEVFNVWPDGYGIGNNGSQVTYDNPPYMETETVHGGDQSMPYFYGKGGATNSEATMDVGGANWTYGNAKTLVLYFHGDPENDPAQLYVKIGTTRINYPGEPAGVTAPLWKQWNIDLSGLSVSRVTSLTIGVDGPGSGLLFIDDIRLYYEAPAMPDPAADPGQTGLQAYYPMSGSVADTSGNNRNGSAEAGTGFGEGPIGYGQALTLDGTDTAYATIPVGPVVQASDSMTIAAWVSRASGGANQRVFDFGNNTTEYMFMSPNSGGGVRFAITVAGGGNNESEVVSDSGLPTDGSWHHVAITIDGAAAEMSLYVDGALADTATTEVLPSDLGSTTNNWISRSQWTADPYMSGAIDEFRIYNRALSDAEVRYLMGDR